MGEAKLGCDIMWAVENNEESIFLRGLFAAAGGCKSNRIAILMTTYRSIKNVSVEGVKEPVFIEKDRMAFQLPIFDKKLPNSARIRVTYSD